MCSTTGVSGVRPFWSPDAMADYIRRGYSRQGEWDKAAECCPLALLADVALLPLEERHWTHSSGNLDDVDGRDDFVQAPAARSMMALSDHCVNPLVAIAENGVDIDLVAHARRLAHADDEQHLARKVDVWYRGDRPVAHDSLPDRRPIGRVE